MRPCTMSIRLSRMKMPSSGKSAERKTRRDQRIEASIRNLWGDCPVRVNTQVVRSTMIMREGMCPKPQLRSPSSQWKTTTTICSRAFKSWQPTGLVASVQRASREEITYTASISKPWLRWTFSRFWRQRQRVKRQRPIRCSQWGRTTKSSPTTL